MQESQETWVRSLGWKDPLEEEMATHSSILAWKILWTEKPGGLQSMWVTKNQTDMTEWLSTQALLYTKWITKKNLLDSPENYTQYLAITGTSLVVQGFWIHLAMQEIWIWSLVQELRSHKLWSNNPACCYYWMHVLQSPHEEHTCHD